VDRDDLACCLALAGDLEVVFDRPERAARESRDFAIWNTFCQLPEKGGARCADASKQ
jgi:hypothetical protein